MAAIRRVMATGRVDVSGGLTSRTGNCIARLLSNRLAAETPTVGGKQLQSLRSIQMRGFFQVHPSRLIILSLSLLCLCSVAGDGGDGIQGLGCVRKK